MKRDLPISSAVPASTAEVLYDAANDLTAQEDQRIDARADELMQDKIADVETYKVFASDARSVTVDEQIHRALMNIDNACYGDYASENAVLNAVANIQKVYKAWCEATYRDECRGEAEHEFWEAA